MMVSRYPFHIEWSDEDQCFIGSALPLIGQCCHRNDEIEVYRQLCVIVDEWIVIKSSDAEGFTNTSDRVAGARDPS